tara:strand:+ start:1 stop:1149 length:1149 start_codon:yes stop_codon:yes gene_type:complete
MTLPTGESPISFSQIRAEFGDGANTSSSPVRLGQYRRDDSSFSNKTVGSFSNQPLDDGIPTSGTINVDTFHGKSLNVIVDYHSGSADEGGTRPEDAKSRYSSSASSLGNSSGKWNVIGGYKNPNSNSAGTKVKINVNKGIGSQAVGGNGVEICALRTGTWDANTILSVDVGGSGKIRGAGGDGGPGGDNENAGSNGEEGNSALGIQYSGTTVNVASGGQIICGYGGGGGGGGHFQEDGFMFFDQERYAGGGGGGGGAGVPAGAGADGGEANGSGGDGSAGSAQAGGEQGGAGGGGGENGEADGGEAGRGRDQTSLGNGGASETGIANGEGGAGGSGAGGSPGSDGFAIRKSASGVTYTLNNSGTITGQQASTSSGGSGTSVG